ncbi:MAG: MTH1187 family thiamine-binding protein [Candidatus Nitrosotenuis sp.]|uniref:Thiamine-binding protein domain-containing protein n=1 Tax=Candidatus Nitrosotenuis uzonensis TaxID=1407055 RepID=A0A812F3H9_9ARCH|nr:MTH1187 family thiamine-binding protein [Candidatus Nitrosotenuis uzonensis]CAE6500433.1 conserved hypothetical protein [Candidatus Nitrosotenuis uzonensis]
MIHAEISIYPIGTDNTSLSFYIAKAVDSIKEFKSVKHQLTPMGTILESDRLENIFEAARAMMETVHMLGVKRVEVVLKIDSRQDKNQTMQEKVDSVRRHL